MRVIEPRNLKNKRNGLRRPPRRSRLGIFLVIFVLLGSIAGGAYWRYSQPLPPLVFHKSLPKYSVTEPSFYWAPTSHSAVGAVGYGVLASSSKEETMRPTASIAKVITALTVLDSKPIKSGEQGDLIPITEADEDLYRYYLTIDGTVSGVTAGTPVTAYQAIQALLLPSSNNMADTLAIWAFGSMESYVEHANEYVAKVGMINTKVADASGFSPETMSTPSDLVRLGLLALENTVVADIVNQKEATLPGAGTIFNTNRLIGINGVNGIKTGTTDEAGGCFLVSSKQSFVDGNEVVIVAAIMGAPRFVDAMNQAQPLIGQVAQGFGDVLVASEGQQFGDVETAWGEKSAIVAKNDALIFGWQYAHPSVEVSIQEKHANKNDTVGEATVSLNNKDVKVELIQHDNLKDPTILWMWTRAVVL